LVNLHCPKVAMSRLGKLLKYASTVQRATGKSYLRQAAEILRLSRGAQQLGVEEYYELEIFDDKHYPGKAKDDCIGWRASAQLDRKLNHNYWRATANDKVLNYALLQQYGLPAPETIATFSVDKRRVGRERSLTTQSELEAYLAGELSLPVFIKPIHGSYGRGTHLLTAYDATTREFTDFQGKRVGFDELVRVCKTRKFSGMLFQKPLQPHPVLRALTGPATSCVRVIVTVPATGPEIHGAFWKVARTHNITDNFHMGATGNLLAAVDATTGTVGRVITGFWPDGKEVRAHPDTHQALVGQALPDWQRAMDLCRDAAVHFQWLRLQHWDVAFCEAGPVLMELNTEADLGVPQLLTRRPFFDDALKRLAVQGVAR
jgi:Sugar-transfer associated ATP-grasp